MRSIVEEVLEDEFEFIQVTARIWGRIVRGVLTLAKLRKFWSFLGTYLKEVKRRGTALGP